MSLRRRLNQLDARVGFGPNEGESSLAWLARKNSRSPIVTAVREGEARIRALEERVTALEARGK